MPRFSSISSGFGVRVYVRRCQWNAIHLLNVQWINISLSFEAFTVHHFRRHYFLSYHICISLQVRADKQSKWENGKATQSDRVCEKKITHKTYKQITRTLVFFHSRLSESPVNFWTLWAIHCRTNMYQQIFLYIMKHQKKEQEEEQQQIGVILCRYLSF